MTPPAPDRAAQGERHSLPKNATKRCGNCFHFDEEDNGACNEYDLPVFKKKDDAACRYWMEVPDNE